MRDLWVQEFLREHVVGVVLPSDLVGSIIMEIFHSGEGEDVEQMARTSKLISRVCDCLSLPLSLVFICLAWFIVYILTCLIYMLRLF